MSVLDKLLNAPRRIRRVLSALVRMPTNVSGTHAQLNELRKELNTLNVAQADLKSELRSELRAANADRADLRSEFLTQLGFALNADRADFKSEFWTDLRSELWPQLVSELRNELSILNADRADLRSELLTQLGFALSADRADLKSEFWTDLRSEFWPQLIDEVRNELSVLNADRADLKSEFLTQLGSALNADRANLRSEFWPQLSAELRNELSALNADRADMKSEFLTQLGFYFHDFGRLFSDTSFQSQLQELGRVQSEIKNLVLHNITSVHTRLNTLENEKLVGLNEQILEVTARLLEQTALVTAGERVNWTAQRGERYKPAKQKPLDYWLAKASKEFPKTYPLWHERLLATQDAFRQTKVGNAAHAGDPRSRIFRSLVETNAIGRVLDVGCGVFGRPYYLVSYPAELISGIDPLAPVQTPDFEFVQGVSEFLPWPDASFSTVISATSLDHCLSLEKSLAELRRVLRPGGRLLLWIDSVPGSPSYQPESDSFQPADQFHLFHFDVAWLEPELDRCWEILDRIELRRTGFTQVIYSLTLKDKERETLKAAQ
jgi:SAM-dependent methyltransferase